MLKLNLFNRLPTGRIVDTIFERSSHELGTFAYSGDYLGEFTLDQNFMSHLLEEPVDTVTWLRIKYPGTYPIHFDLIYSSSFSFELHTDNKIIHFSEHNPKHNIYLVPGDNCVLMYKQIPTIIHVGSKIYVYYNI